MIRRSSPGRAAPRRLALRTLALLLVLALGAAACGSADTEPTLTTERPPAPASTTSEVASAPSPAAAAESPPDAPTTTAVPLSRTTEPTILVTAPPAAPGDEVALPFSPRRTCRTCHCRRRWRTPVSPSCRSSNSRHLRRPRPAPTTAPSWEPVTVLTSRDDVNTIIPVYDAPNGTRLAFPDGDLWSYTYRRNRLVARVLQGPRATSGYRWSCRCGPMGLAAGFGLSTSTGRSSVTTSSSTSRIAAWRSTRATTWSPPRGRSWASRRRPLRRSRDSS